MRRGSSEIHSFQKEKNREELGLHSGMEEHTWSFFKNPCLSDGQFAIAQRDGRLPVKLFQNNSFGGRFAIAQRDCTPQFELLNKSVDHKERERGRDDSKSHSRMADHKSSFFKNPYLPESRKRGHVKKFACCCKAAPQNTVQSQCFPCRGATTAAPYFYQEHVVQVANVIFLAGAGARPTVGSSQISIVGEGSHGVTP